MPTFTVYCPNCNRLTLLYDNINISGCPQCHETPAEVLNFGTLVQLVWAPIVDEDPTSVADPTLQDSGVTAPSPQGPLTVTDSESSDDEDSIPVIDLAQVWLDEMSEQDEATPAA